MTRGGGSARGARFLASLVATALALVILAAGCTGGDAGDETDAPIHGGADDLPGPLPEGVSFRKSPSNAAAAPDFSAELLDGTSVSASDLWDDRPLVLVFTAGGCNECERVHREVAEVVDGHDGAVSMLAVVRANDIQAAREFAEGQQLGYPIAVGDEGAWLSYAAEEAPLVVLIAPGGKALRGWPGDVDAGLLDEQLDKLYKESPALDE